MAIAFDAASIGETASGTGLTVSHTCSGANRLLLVSASQFEAGGAPAEFTATYNSVGTAAITGGSVAGSTLRLSTRKLVAPATGANDIVIASATAEIVMSAVSYTDIHQTTPNGNAVTATAGGVDPISVDVSSEAGDLVVDAIAVFNNTPVPGAGQTERAANVNGSAVETTSCSEEAGAGTVTMSWTFGVETSSKLQVALNLNAAPPALQREQEGFRWRADDGDEDAATWLASQDTDINRAKDTVTRLRMLTNVTSDPPSEALKLQWRKVGDSTWNDLGTG